VQRYILQVRGIAERAVQLGSSEKSNRDMIIRYRGTVDGRNVFLVIKPYFDRVQGTDDSFQTLLHVSAVNGVVFSSQTISRTKWGIWNVSATYAVNNGDGMVRGDEFIYPVTMKGPYQEKTPTSDNVLTLDATINNTEVYRITPPAPEKSKIPY
jgi:hypothetical protein